MEDLTQRIVITGASGFLGTRLVQALRAEGYDVVTLQRGHTEQPQSSHASAARDAEHTQTLVQAQCEDAAQHTAPWDPSAGKLDPSVLAGALAVICLSGANLAGKAWTVDYRWEIMTSRFDPVDTLVDTMAELDPDERPHTFICASAVGYYGYDTQGTIVDESSPHGPGFLADVCQRWEEHAQRATALGVRTVNLRTGLVIGADGGLLAQMLPAYRLGVGARLGSGEAWMPLISTLDWVRAVLWLLTHKDMRGPVNLCCPNPVQNHDFHALVARRVRRPGFMVIPQAPLRMIAPTFAREMIFASQRAIPTALLESGFHFTAPNALRIVQQALPRR